MCRLDVYQKKLEHLRNYRVFRDRAHERILSTPVELVIFGIPHIPRREKNSCVRDTVQKAILQAGLLPVGVPASLSVQKGHSEYVRLRSESRLTVERSEEDWVEVLRQIFSCRRQVVVSDVVARVHFDPSFVSRQKCIRVFIREAATLLEVYLVYYPWDASQIRIRLAVNAWVWVVQ